MLQGIENGSIGYGVTANIAASHAAARGSIPRIRVLFSRAFSLVSSSILITNRERESDYLRI